MNIAKEDADSVVYLATQLRAAGCIRARWGDIELELFPPQKPGLAAISEEIAELPTTQREELLAEIKRQNDADLFGAT